MIATERYQNAFAWSLRELKTACSLGARVVTYAAVRSLTQANTRAWVGHPSPAVE